MHTIMVLEQVKTMKSQAGVQVLRPGELRIHLQLWKCFGRLYFIVIVLNRNITVILDYNSFNAWKMPENLKNASKLQVFRLQTLRKVEGWDLGKEIASRMWIEGPYVERVVIVFDVQRSATTKVKKEEIQKREIEADLHLLQQVTEINDSNIKVSTFAYMKGMETYDLSFLRQADEVMEEHIAGYLFS
ncbi:hypothetical protein Tco_1286112 [Tanacetum coccineum]